MSIQYSTRKSWNVLLSILESKKSFPRNLMSDEISLSVEDTNELRRKLGLKPLRIETASIPESTSSDSKNIQVTTKPARDKDTDEGKRLFQELSGGGGILDLFDDPVASDESEERLPKMRKTDSSESEDSSPRTSNSSDNSDSE